MSFNNHSIIIFIKEMSMIYILHKLLFNKYLLPVTIYDNPPSYNPPPPPSEVVRFLWKMQNVLNRMGDMIKKILRFLFFELLWKIRFPEVFPTVNFPTPNFPTQFFRRQIFRHNFSDGKFSDKQIFRNQIFRQQIFRQTYFPTIKIILVSSEQTVT